jgi:hypothetical protein
VALADWYPDGARIAFLRVRTLPAGLDGGTRRQWLLGVRELASGVERTLYEPRDVPLDLRIAPDGRAIALIEGPSVLNTRFSLSLVDSESGSVRNVIAPGHPLGCLAWAASGQLVLARAGSPLGDGSGSPGRVFLLDPRRRSERGLLYTSGLFPLAGGIESRTGSCDVLGPGQLVLDQNEWRMNLHELPLGDSRSGSRPLTSGDSRDRQPAYSPDGSRIVFSSNRSGNMDLWLLERATGSLRQLTDDPAQDWDPGFTPDGRHLLWSSDRSGNLEIWIADVDGGNARQLTRDGVDAENPTATRDGRYVCYTTAHPERVGLWRIRLDGSDDRQLVKGDALVPEVSPDGRYAVYLGDVRASRRVLKVAEVESGAVVPFEIEVAWPARASGQVLFGRERWLPDGRRIAFVGADAAGRSGVWVQDFVPGRDTAASRRPLAGFADHAETESLGVSADGKMLVVSELLEYSSLRLADGLSEIAGTSRQAGR